MNRSMDSSHVLIRPMNRSTRRPLNSPPVLPLRYNMPELDEISLMGKASDHEDDRSDVEFLESLSFEIADVESDDEHP